MAKRRVRYVKQVTCNLPENIELSWSAKLDLTDAEDKADLRDLSWQALALNGRNADAAMKYKLLFSVTYERALEVVKEYVRIRLFVRRECHAGGR